jgi:hypothetical protein
MVMIVPDNDAAALTLRTAELGIDCFDIGSVITAETGSRVRYST